MKLLIMGRPGAGKGTQAVNIKEYFHIPHISTGDMFREALKNQTELGKVAQKYMDQGLLVPDEVTIGLVKERLAESDCKDGFLLDGFPRTIAQAKSLEELLNANGMKLDAVLDVDVPVEVLVKRIVGRRICKNCATPYHIEFNKPKVEGICDVCGGPLLQRPDDSLEAVEKRLNEYDSKTAPLLDFYKERHLLKTVNGDQSLEKVFEDIKAVLGA